MPRQMILAFEGVCATKGRALVGPGILMHRLDVSFKLTWLGELITALLANVLQT